MRIEFAGSNEDALRMRVIEIFFGLKSGNFPKIFCQTVYSTSKQLDEIYEAFVLASVTTFTAVECGKKGTKKNLVLVIVVSFQWSSSLPQIKMAEFANYLKRDLVSHTRLVQSLFKRIVRNETSFYRDHFDIKYQWAIIRAEFEKHRNVKDLRIAKMLLEEGERKLFLHQHPVPRKFMWSPGGLMYEREHVYRDSHLDLWHPMEKARYPYYFERREQLKKEFVEQWKKGNQDRASFGNPDSKNTMVWGSER